ncbi:unnamed protein product, partial [marine sediment metagenome]
MEVAYQAIDDYFSGSGESDESLFLEKYNDINRKVFIGFRINGDKKGSAVAVENNLAKSVYKAALRALEDQRYKGSITENDLKDLKIEIKIFGDEKILDQYYEKGIHGLRLEEEGSNGNYYTTVAIEKNNGIQTLLKRLCEAAGLDENCHQDENVNIYYFPIIHFATTIYSDEITTFYRCNVIDFKPNVNEKKIKESLNLAEGWMLLNLDEDGLFNYEYHPSSDEYIKKDNALRQLLSSRWLAEKSKENDVLKQMHKVNLDYILRNWYKEDGELGY